MTNSKRTPLHNRNIFLRGFINENNLFEIEAELVDTKHYDVPNNDRGNILKGEPIHHMKIKCIIDKDKTIIFASALTLKGPFKVCKYANRNFGKLAGIKIKPGWKKEALKIIGGLKGCTHISELLSPIATTAFQTIEGYKSQNNREIKNINHRKDEKPALIGTCHAFNPKGEIVKRIWPKWHEN